MTTESAGGNNQGRASRRGGTYETPHDFGAAIFTTELNQSVFEEHFRATAVHEAGHLLDTGFNDEDEHDGDDVYSGSGNDLTPEVVEIRGNDVVEWSVMARSWQPKYNQSPMSGDYVAFSMEELMTVDVENIDSRDE